MAYNLRARNSVPSYNESVHLPRAQRVKTPDPNALYPVEVLETEDGRAKVHWVGYSSERDEWIPTDSLTTLPPKLPEDAVEQYSPFDPHKELAFRIKSSLTSASRNDVDVKIELPFDPVVFRGGLRCQGKLIRRWGDNNIYGVESYAQLAPLLGKNWHIRILNEHMDFCYVNLASVAYYLRKRRSLVEYTTEGHKEHISGGHIVVFKFVRMDGVRRHLQSVIAVG